MNLGTHTDRAYDEQLRAIRAKLALMAAHVAAVIASAERALSAQDAELARRTIARDDVLDRFEREIDEACLVVLATRAPMGSDLRFVTTAMKIAVELERAGDLAVGVCERALAFEGGQLLFGADEASDSAQQVIGMLNDAIDAFVRADPDKAEAALAREREVNARFARVFDRTLELMAEDPQRIPRGAQVQSIAKRFERMADHATNIAKLALELLEGAPARG